MNRITLGTLVGLTLLASCETTGETAGSNQLSTNVGIYSPAPVGLSRPRVGVPPMGVGSDASAGMEHLAADQLATLLVRTDRFEVIERGQLQMLLDEQDLEGIVANGQLAEPAVIQGIDYLVIGKVTNLRMKQTKTSSKAGLGGIIGFQRSSYSGRASGLDYDSTRVEMKVECGVDLRLVDPSTGSLLDASFSEYTRTDSASSFGVRVLGVGADSNAEIEMSEDDRGLILRLALDDALRRMLPSLDRKLMARTREIQANASAGTPAATPAAHSVGESNKAAFCSQCGTKAAANATFCASCGTKIGG